MAFSSPTCMKTDHWKLNKLSSPLAVVAPNEHLVFRMETGREMGSIVEATCSLHPEAMGRNMKALWLFPHPTAGACWDRFLGWCGRLYPSSRYTEKTQHAAVVGQRSISLY